MTPLAAGEASQTRNREAVCHNCEGTDITVFYEVRGVPAHSVLLIRTKQEALDFPQGDIVLGYCEQCQFVSNLAFNPALQSYSLDYEETQSFSPTFRDFHRKLANVLVDHYGIRKKHVIEIGCGKGDFLAMLCEIGANTGVGFDPAFVPQRNPAATSRNVTFIQDFYSEVYADQTADLICCKMTLEHIPTTRQFLTTIRKAMSKSSKPLVFFQVPDFGRIIHERAFWDIYYEHCSYFTSTSLKHLFTSCGFNVLALETAYDGQYLQVFATPGAPSDAWRSPAAADAHGHAMSLAAFSDAIHDSVDTWSTLLKEASDRGQRVLVWGSGSKAVSFLGAVHNAELINYVVDINPYRQGHYIPGTGQLIVGPEFVEQYRPDTVIVMNAIYVEEIERMLAGFGLHPRLLSL